MKFDPLEHPVCLDLPIWLEETAWAGHLPFGMFLISTMQPRVYVELGVDRGTSYSALCQAVVQTGAETRCFGIDTWQGDEHAGSRTDDVLARLREHHDPRYSSFSKLHRSTFDAALPEFPDGSIDLLHIDGFHTYDAVRHDYETWLPKMSDRGIVLFHDTTVRDRDFGVWKFWSEVSSGRPHFEFAHSNGLGVLSVGDYIADGLQPFFDCKEEEHALIRQFFEAVGGRCEALVQNRHQREKIDELYDYAALVKDSWLLSSYHKARRGFGRTYRGE